MRTLIAFLALVVLLSLSACGQDFDAEAEQETLQSIWQELNALNENVILEVFDKYVDKDFEFFVARLDWYGPGNRSWWLNSEEGTTVTTKKVEWMITPDMAVAKSDLTYSLPGEKDVDYLVTDVFKKKDGQWYAIHRHLSEVPFRID